MRSKHESKPKTISYYENSLNRLLEFEALRDARLDKVDDQLVADYVLKRKAATKSNGKRIKVSTLNLQAILAAAS